MNTRTAFTRRSLIRGITIAGAASLARAANTAQQLPAGYTWDHSITNFASLKQSTLKFAARKGNNIPVLSLFGDIDRLRETAKTPAWLDQQSPSGWLRGIDALVIKGAGHMPFHEMMIKQRERISECIHLKLVPPYRFRYLDPLTANPRAMVTWIETQDWRYPWPVGNIDMDTAYALAFDWKVMGNARAHDALVTWFDWHDKHFDPKIGFWDFARTGELRNCMAGAMHQLGIYFMFNHEIPWPEQAADTTLALQEPTGLFATNSFSDNCLDIDAVFILANLYNRYGVRKAKIREALERALAANLKCFHPDGGALHRAGIDRDADWWSTWCRIAIIAWSSRILGISDFAGPWDFRPRHPFKAEDGGKALPSWTDDRWYAAADWPRPKPATSAG
jgi:hypothetical protein